MSQDELCSGSREALVVHGANSVCGQVAGSRWALNTGLFVAIALTTAIVFSSSRARRLRRHLVSFALLFALPGMAALLFFRADSPRRRYETTARVATLESSMHSFARAHGCATVTKGRCVACDPVARFATAHAGSCTSGAAIELGPHALDGSCVAVGSTLRCGVR